MSVPILHGSFTAGEISPALFGQVTLAKFSSAASTCRNAYVDFRGAARSRAGTAYCLLSKTTFASGNQPRLITFQYKVNQGYALEVGAFYMRFYFQGAPILEATKNITGATAANPCVITSVAHGFSNGDWVYITAVGGMTQLNGRFFSVSNVTANTFRIVSLFTGSAVDATTYTAYTAGGTVARVYTLTTPWAGADVQYLKFTQSADTMSFTCVVPNSVNQHVPYDLARIAANSWTLTAATFGATLSAPTGVFCLTSTTPSSSTSPPTLPCAYAYVVTAVAANGSESNPSTTANVTNAVDMTITANSITVTWKAATGAASYNIYRAPPSYNTSPGDPNNALPVPPGAIFSYVGNTSGTQFIDANIIPDATTSPPSHQNPFSPGAVQFFTPTAAGNAYSVNTTISITSGTGSGFVGVPIIVAGQLIGAIVQNGGTLYAGTDTAVITDPGLQATGTITFAVNPTAADTITLNGVTWTFVATITAAAQTLIGATLTTTLASLQTALNQSTNASLSVASYVCANGVLNVRYTAGGAGGNAYTLAASAATPSAGTLAGGAAGTGSGATASITVGPAITTTTGTYPSTVSYHQQRRVYAGTVSNPNTLYMSRPGQFLNFDTAIPSSAVDAITATPWSQQVDGVQWLIAEPGGLIVMTGKGAWQVSGGGSPLYGLQPITPSNVLAAPETFSGCSPIVPPILINNDIQYVQAKGAAVRAMAYSYITNNYAGVDQTVLSGHLFTGYTLHEWAWCEEPYKIVWAVRSDGVMLSQTYFKEQEVFGWARHDTQGRFVSVTSVSEIASSERADAVNGASAPLISIDALYVAVERFTPNGTFYFIERMDDRLWSNVETPWCVDCGLQLAQATPGGTISANFTTGGGVTFTTSATPFVVGDVGSVIRVGGGIATITAYGAANSVVGNWNLAPSGIVPGISSCQFLDPIDWTITAPVISVGGMEHLAGLNVVGLADGIPVGPLAVSTGATPGRVNLPFVASYVTLGLSFTPQVQSPYVDAGNPTVQGQRKDIIAATARVESSLNVSIGVNQPDGSVQQPPSIAPTWSGLTAGIVVDQENVAPTYVSPGGQTVTQLYTGDLRALVSSDWQVQGQVAVQQTLPLPLNVLAFVPELLSGDLPEQAYGQLPPKQRTGHEGPSGWMQR